MSKCDPISASADLTELEAEADGAAEKAEGMAEAVSGPGARDRWALLRTASPRPMLPPLGT